ncbi:hypothetical protein MLD38_005740 [Melastoma candidum]|uniref:Uncharacterized protein n=1 Tax=Melastoma candidum TaxID=119954 RepID=A0ACB9RK23_9MYRT|nr:hypothetical protein MLD38_005740 [Melastoma candidum]
MNENEIVQNLSGETIYGTRLMQSSSFSELDSAVDHIFSKTTLTSLLQPPPERCPGPKAVADFLPIMQLDAIIVKVTSREDQRQHWEKEEQHYQYISVSELVEAFVSCHLGIAMEQDLRRPFENSKSHPAALTKWEYSGSKIHLFKACLSREAALIRRSLVFHITKVFHVEFQVPVAQFRIVN